MRRSEASVFVGSPVDGPPRWISITTRGSSRLIANPIASILSAAMLLEHFNLFDEAMAIRDAVDKALEKGVVTPELNKKSDYGTTDVGDFIADYIANSTDNFNMNDENIGLGKSTII